MSSIRRHTDTNRTLLAGLDGSRLYTLAEFNSMSEDMKQNLFTNRVQQLKEHFGQDEVQPNTVIPTYAKLKTIHSYVMSHFKYTSDMVAYNKADMWDTEVFRRILICGVLKDDCDGAGSAMLQLAYYVFGFKKDMIYMVACATETNEGHYVTWHQCDDGIYYQIENRVRKPRTVKYMREFGYDYWDYASLTSPMNWKKAKQKVANIIYNTPNNIASDAPEFSFRKALSVDKSKMLVKDWFGFISGTTITVVSVVKDNASELVNTLQSNQHNLSQFIDAKEVGILMVLLSVIGIYLRTVTHKDIDEKRDYDN